MTPVAEAPQITTDKRMPAAARTDLLAGHLGDRRNSLDLLRLFAASLVIFGHSYAIVGRGTEPMVAWNGAIFSGGFALYIFFFLSGMLVTNSFRLKPDIVQWYTARALRIFPALCVCMVLTVFVLGPIATTLSTGSYLKAGDTWDYFAGNLLLLRTRYFLPGVFGGKAINGPLWSLYLEVRLYLFFGALLWIFRGRRREWPTMAIAALAIAGIVKPRWVFVFGENDNHIVCSGLFLLGALCALWSDKVLVSGVWLAVMFVAINKYVHTPAFLPLFFFFSSYFVLYFGFSKRLSRIRLPGDYSYGLYIYGWPVQQMLALSFPRWPPELNAAVSLGGALTLAAMSWHGLEKHILAHKKTVGQAIRRRLRLVVIAGGSVAAILAALYFWPAVERLGPITAFGPSEIVAGEKFNTQPDGVSGLWVKLGVPAGKNSQIVFGGHELAGAVSGDVVTGAVPVEYFAKPGIAEVYVIDRGHSPAWRSAKVRIPVLRREK
jgi:peptidoglycan/LPS O-acetylase OafA/YrhL